MERGYWQPDVRLGRRTLRECCEAYLEENPRVGERWAETRRRNMRLHLGDLLDRPIATITPPMVRAWHAKALRGTGGRTAISQSYRLIRAVLNVAVQDGAIVRNPKSTVAIPPHIIPLLQEHARQFAGPTYFTVDRDGGQIRGNTVYRRESATQVLLRRAMNASTSPAKPRARARATSAAGVAAVIGHKRCTDLEGD